MQSSTRALLSVQVVARTDDFVTVELRSCAGPAADQPLVPVWRYNFPHRFSKPMELEKTASHAANQYFIDNPGQLKRVGRVAVATALLYVLRPR
jgi:hypothetical protein